MEGGLGPCTLSDGAKLSISCSHCKVFWSDWIETFVLAPKIWTYSSSHFRPPRPALLAFLQVPGHEVIGVVEEVGSAVNHLKKGDNVGEFPAVSAD